MTNRKLFLLAGAMALTLSLTAQSNFQPGYYLTCQADTIWGEIDDRGDERNCRVCIFRPGQGEESVTFGAGEIRAYRFSDGGRYYVSREVKIGNENQEVFLEFLVNGISDLYYYRGKGLDRYYLESEDGRFTELSNDLVRIQVDGKAYSRPSNLYVGQMKASFGDCAEIQPSLDRARFSQQSLMQLTMDYHDYLCDDEACIIYRKPMPVIQISGGLYAGIVNSSLDFPSYEGSDSDFNADASYKWYHYYDFNRQNDLMVGLRLHFSLPRVNERLGLLVMAEYNQADFYSYTEDQTSPGLQTRMEANAHVSSMNLMPGIQYAFPRGNIRPDFTIGPVLCVDMNSYFDMEHTLVTGALEILQDYHTEPIRGIVMGGFSQLGADWGIRGPHHLGCKLRYHFTRQRTEHYINRDGLALSMYYSYSFNQGKK